MKDYQLKSTAPTIPCQSALSKALEHAGVEPVITLGLDIALATPAGALIVGGGTPLDLGKHPRLKSSGTIPPPTLPCQPI